MDSYDDILHNINSLKIEINELNIVHAPKLEYYLDQIKKSVEEENKKIKEVNKYI